MKFDADKNLRIKSKVTRNLKVTDKCSKSVDINLRKEIQIILMKRKEKNGNYKLYFLCYLIIFNISLFIFNNTMWIYLTKKILN